MPSSIWNEYVSTSRLWHILRKRHLSSSNCLPACLQDCIPCTSPTHQLTHQSLPVPGELSSLEEALGALLTSGQLRPGVIKALWAVAGPACHRLAASGGADEAARVEARGCFAVLAAASDGHPQHVATNLVQLVQVCYLHSSQSRQMLCGTSCYATRIIFGRKSLQ